MNARIANPAPVNTSLAPAPVDPREVRHKRLTQAAQRLVGQTFFGTIFKQMRNSPFKSSLFSGGRGGEAFTAMQDQLLAERMARGAGRKLADSIVKHIERRNGDRLTLRA